MRTDELEGLSGDLARLRYDLAALRFKLIERKYNPDQPRTPAGNGVESGRWAGFPGWHPANLVNGRPIRTKGRATGQAYFMTPDSGADHGSYKPFPSGGAPSAGAKDEVVVRPPAHDLGAIDTHPERIGETADVTPSFSAPDLDSSVPNIRPVGERASPPTSGALGELSARFESGGRGPGTVSTGFIKVDGVLKPDPGGISYGTYQLASKRNRPQEFLESEGKPWAAEFGTNAPGTKEFSSIWRRIAAAVPAAFKSAQYNFMIRTHYNPQAHLIQAETGLNVNQRSMALRNVVFATATQHGPSTDTVTSAVRNLRRSGVDTSSSNSDAALIGEIFKIRTKKSPATASHYRDERVFALQMLRR